MRYIHKNTGIIWGVQGGRSVCIKGVGCWNTGDVASKYLEWPSVEWYRIDFETYYNESRR